MKDPYTPLRFTAADDGLKTRVTGARERLEEWAALGFGKKVGKAYKGRKGNLSSRSAARNNGYPSGSGQL
jgi:hypothetical protein